MLVSELFFITYSKIGILLMGSNEEEHLAEHTPKLVRSLSMSSNVASSVVEEVSHMIRMAPTSTSVSSPVFFGTKGTMNSAAMSAATDFGLPSSGSFVPETGGGYLNSKSQAIISQTSSKAGGQNSSSVIEVLKTDALRAVGDVSEKLNMLASMSSLRKNELLEAIVVSRWDNIVGPQCVYLWTEEVTSVFYPTVFSSTLSPLIKYVTEHTVDHQEDENVVASTRRITLCIVPDLNFVYLSLSIRLPPEFDPVMNDHIPSSTIPHAISILGNMQFLPRFLALRPLFVSWLSEFSPKIGVFLVQVWF